MTSTNRCTDPANGKIAELMPWYVNGTLPAHERAVLERHLGECLSCRAALKQEQRMQSLTRSQSDLPVNAQDGVVDLLQRIERQSAPPRTAQWGLRLAYAAAFALCIVAGWWVLELPDTQPRFVTLSTPAAPDSALIDIVFADSVTESEIREILSAIGGEMIAGPSQLGRYTVRVRPDADGGTVTAIESLSEDSRIEFVGRNFIPAQPAATQESQ